MKLLNDYKVIYSAYRNEELHAYATKKLPKVEDVALTYINEEGTELSAEDIKAIKLVYSKDNSLYYSLTGLPAEDDHKLYVYCEDELVFGDEDAPQPVPPTPVEKYAVNVANIENVVITGAGEYEEGANVKITIKAANGYQFAEGNAPKVGEEALVAEGDKFVYEFAMGTEEVNITIDGVLVEEVPVVEPDKVFYYEAEEAPVAITDDFLYSELEDGAEDVTLYFGGGKNVYYAVAVPANKAFSAAYQPAMPETDILDAQFNASDVEFEGKAYKLYVTESKHSTVGTDHEEYRFVF